MTQSTSQLSFEDVRGIFDRALASEKGIRVTQTSPGQAIHMRQRLYRFRAADRKQSMQIYAKGDSGFGVSAYDSLIVKVEGNCVFILPADSATLEIEELT